jgi:L-fuculose-phosphate aldolase
MSGTDTLKATVATAVRLLAAEGLMDMNGHVSARLPGTDRLLINERRAGRTTVRPRDIVTVDLRGRPVGGDGRRLRSGRRSRTRRGEAPLEVPLHTRIYAARPDVGCVAHLHPAAATVFTIAGRPLVPVFQLGAIFPADGLPVYDDPDLITTDAEADAIARVLGDGRAVLLRGHGAVVVAEDVETCFATAIWLEENAKKQLWASVLGAPRPFSDDVVRRVRASLWHRQILLKTWDHYATKGRREGIL